MSSERIQFAVRVDLGIGADNVTEACWEVHLPIIVALRKLTEGRVGGSDHERVRWRVSLLGGEHAVEVSIGQLLSYRKFRRACRRVLGWELYPLSGREWDKLLSVAFERRLVWSDEDEQAAMPPAPAEQQEDQRTDIN